MRNRIPRVTSIRGQRVSEARDGKGAVGCQWNISHDIADLWLSQLPNLLLLAPLLHYLAIDTTRYDIQILLELKQIIKGGGWGKGHPLSTNLYKTRDLYLAIKALKTGLCFIFSYRRKKTGGACVHSLSEFRLFRGAFVFQPHKQLF